MVHRDERTPTGSPEPSRHLSLERRHVYTVLHHLGELQRDPAINVESVLFEINTAGVMSVPGARYAGITIVDPAAGVASLAATHHYPRVLDDVQRETGEGPCLSSAGAQRVRVNDLAAEERWPRYRLAALSRTPIRSIISLRLFNDVRGMAALNFYAETPGVFDDESVDVGLVFAAHVAVAWNLVRREDQFREALASRDIIGQAKGMLMERFHIDGGAAFALLRSLSQQSNTKLVTLAQQLIALDYPWNE